MEEYRRILVPVDGSDLSKKAFRKATSLAKKFGSEVAIIHVYERLPGSWGIPGMEGLDLPVEQIIEQTKEAAERLTREYEKIGKEMGVEISSSMVEGDPADEIIKTSDEFDMIVMGTHGRGGLLHLLIGSTAERVARHACCPVFLIREKKKGC